MDRKKPDWFAESNRRNVLRTIGVLGLAGTAATGTSAATSKQNGLAEASEFFKKKLDRHGDVKNVEVKGLGEQSAGRGRDWRVKYTFEDGSQFPTFYSLGSSTLELQIAGERFTIDRGSYENNLARTLSNEMESVESDLNGQLKAKASSMRGND